MSSCVEKKDCLVQASVTKISQTRWLKQQKFISHSYRSWEALDQGDSPHGAGEALLPKFADGLSSPCSFTWWRAERKQAPMSSLIPSPNYSESDSKESACSGEDPGSIPGQGRSPGEENGYPLQYSGLENSMAKGAWRATVHRVTESDMTE